LEKIARIKIPELLENTTIADSLSVVRRVVRFYQLDYFISGNSLVVGGVLVGGATFPPKRFTHIYSLFTLTCQLLSNNSRLALPTIVICGLENPTYLFLSIIANNITNLTILNKFK